MHGVDKLFKQFSDTFQDVSGFEKFAYIYAVYLMELFLSAKYWRSEES